jgi:hypothetical protein
MAKGEKVPFNKFNIGQYLQKTRYKYQELNAASVPNNFLRLVIIR